MVESEERSTAEREWCESVCAKLTSAVRKLSRLAESRLTVSTSTRLAYALEAMHYPAKGDLIPRSTYYQTDILVRETFEDGRWIPRVVIEGKLGRIGTHGALTYSQKAATHKHVHPYLRYGILIGNLASGIPGRLVRHGAYFDFMAVWAGREATRKEWSQLIDTVEEELDTSCKLQELFTNPHAAKGKYRFLHRATRFG